MNGVYIEYLRITRVYVNTVMISLRNWYQFCSNTNSQKESFNGTDCEAGALTATPSRRRVGASDLIDLEFISIL